MPPSFSLVNTGVHDAAIVDDESGSSDDGLTGLFVPMFPKPQVERLEACELGDFGRQAAQVLVRQVQGSPAFLYDHLDELQQFVLSHKRPSL